MTAARSVPWPTEGLSFGGDYSPEQWPREVWDEDVRLMREAGVNLVTVGVFSWGAARAVAAEYTWSWLDEVLDLLHANGIAVDLATPTAAPPNWLLTAHPEVLPVDATERRERPGGRLGWCPASPVFREHALRIVDALADRYGRHPAVRLWHVSNELGGGNARCFCEVSAADFRRWLRARYPDVDAANAGLGHGLLGPHLHVVRGGLAAPRCRRRAEPGPGPRLRAVLLGRPAGALHGRARRHRAALGRAGHDELHGRGRLARGRLRRVGRARRHPRERPLHAGGRPGPAEDLAASADRMRGIARGRTPWLLMEHSTGGPSWQQRNRAKEPGELIRNSLAHVARGRTARCSSSGAPRPRVPSSSTPRWSRTPAPGPASGVKCAPSAVRSRRSPRCRAHPSKPPGSRSSWTRRRLGVAGRAQAAPGAPVRARGPGVAHRVLASAGHHGRGPARRRPERVRRGRPADAVRRRRGVGSAHQRRGRPRRDPARHLRVGHRGRDRAGAARRLPGAFRDVLGVWAEEFVPLQRDQHARLDDGTLVTDWAEDLVVEDADVVLRHVDGPLAGRPA